MSDYKEDVALWSEAWLDTPIRTAATHGKSLSRSDAGKLPGNAVKTKERAPNSVWPKWLGVLVSFDREKDSVLVRSHAEDAPPRWVWRGTVAEYCAAWEVD